MVKPVCGRLPLLLAWTVKVSGWPGTSAPPVAGLDELLTPPTVVRGFSTGSGAQPVPVAAPCPGVVIAASVQSLIVVPPGGRGC